ncbi:MAG TPA: oligosaccharide flippase family protein [Gaiellaceae bacterium]|nr:oligosaccharide flippase family protein [Gaiellaceae bacterium]
MRLGLELRRLARHSAIYGLGGLVSRILATLLLPLYTNYLTPREYGRVEIVTASTAVFAIVLQMGIATAFFRFYFDEKEPARKLTVVRTSFWFTMATSTFGLVLGLVFAAQFSHWLGLGHDPALVRAGAVGLWAQTNYNQLTALFRVEQRSAQYAVASVVNVLVTVTAMVVFVAAFHWGPIGLVVGNFTGTLVVYLALLGYRREQLGLEFDRALFRGMQKFGMPLVPSALALWAINWIDREFVVWYSGRAAVGIYSIAVKVASIITFVMVAFRTAWPAFAYSIDDDAEARRTYSYVLTYLLAAVSWVALALGALAPWLVRLLTSKPGYLRAEKGVALLAFAFALYAGYTVLAIGSGRARRTQLNWVVTGTGAAANIGLNFWLVPAYGFVGAAVSTAVAYTVLFVGMTLYAQSVYRVPYQWRRVVTAVAAGVGLTVAARTPHLPFAPSLLLVLAYPLVLAALGFYLPAERRRLRRLVPSLR